jgi:hypothetical protein
MCLTSQLPGRLKIEIGRVEVPSQPGKRGSRDPISMEKTGVVVCTVILATGGSLK